MINQGYRLAGDKIYIYSSFDKIYGQINFKENFYSDTIYFDSNDELGNMPQVIKKIIFEENFLREPNDIPDSVEHIEFHDNFNNPMDNLPSSIKTIKLGNNFNQPVNCLPLCVEKIILGRRFQQDLSNLPKSIYRLELYISDLNDKIINSIPHTITYLVLDMFVFRYDVEYKRVALKDSITHLRIKKSLPYKKIILPQNITHLHLPENFDFVLENLPSSIQYISIGKAYKKTRHYYKCQYKDIIHFN